MGSRTQTMIKMKPAYQPSLILIVLCISLPVYATKSFKDDSCFLDPLPSTSDMDVRKFKYTIHKRNLRSVDELIPLLGDHRDYFTMTYKSDSPEGYITDPAHPRIIAFGSDAQLVIAYNGCPEDQIKKMRLIPHAKKSSSRALIRNLEK